MSLRILACAAAILLTSLCITSAVAAPPNIVFILVDDLRHDTLGVTGHPFVKTPNIDRIGREGAVFRNAFVTTPLCSPSRASFLTGQLVRSHGIRGNGDNSALSQKLVTFPKLIQQTGYETAYVGKWHMGNDDSPRPGFDRWVSFRGQGAHLNPQMNLDGNRRQVNGYMADILTDHSVDFIEKPRSKPFLLYLAHKAVHGPFLPAERHKNLYADPPIKRNPNANDDNKDKPVLLRPVPNQPARPNQPRRARGQAADQLVRNQLRMLTAIDEGIGRIFKSLEETKQLDNTVIVFTSDNGYFWGEHGLGDKRWAYEESIRIPLLIRFPAKVKAGAQLSHLALNIDIAPTLLEVAGAPIPKEVEGVSLLPMLQENRAIRARAFLEYFMEPRFARTPTWRAVRTERWKYIRYEGMPDMDELFDLQADPYEMSNAINKPEARQILKDLRTDLETQFAPMSPAPR